MTNLNDAGAGSLRAAIAAADAANGVQTINFAANANGMINLQSALPAITNSVTINGPTQIASSVTVQRAVTADFRIFTIQPPAANPNFSPAVAILNLTISNGTTTTTDPNGGGILVTNGSLALTSDTVTKNTAVGNGGGIYVSGGMLRLSVTNVTNNQANGSGGGIGLLGGTTTIDNGSLVDTNQAAGDGGGIWLKGFGGNGPNLTISGSAVTNNTGNGNGGGVFANWLGVGQNLNVVVVANSKVNGNRAVTGEGGGIAAAANTSLDARSSVSTNKVGTRMGEAVYIAPQATLTDSGATMTGNQYFPPPPVFGGNAQQRIVDDGLPYAVYVDSGATFIVQYAQISGNDGHGVYGYVTSLGGNYVENSLTTSSGWIASDTVT